MTILNITNLSKSYEDVEAVREVSFAVESGEIVGLLGPNGAGKTTIISMILGILEPSGGSIEILNRTMATDAEEIRRHINFSAVYTHVPANLSVLQNLKVFGLLYDIPNLAQRIDSLLAEFDLVRFKNTKAGLLSSGEMARLNLAKSFINNPKLLLLDEPTASLDPSIARDVREKIQGYTEQTGAAVVWTSHNMKEIENMCTRVLFLSHGKILLSGDPRTLPGKNGMNDLEELFIAVAREPLSINH